MSLLSYDQEPGSLSLRSDLSESTRKDFVEALTFIWKEELTIIFALVHSESKAKLRGINLKDLGKLIT